MTEPHEPPARPPDVDTGFWLWVVALPLMVAAYTVDVVTVQEIPNTLVLAISLAMVVVVAAVVLTFMILMRLGYRWARTLLTGGAIAAVVYSVSNLLGVERPDALAVTYAALVIVGTVLIGGGAYLLHRKDSHDFFSR
ncbi:hypothetical protein FHR72_000930 [Mycolicibacterium iranicum]|uniref:Uncharacterized protein n=1 Tax=Mycolicibacterium iranicum TaxID=912594 RepID=A0A839Q158_MYCIR|nr:hypothetical protein [Mycolicibacterium iranicum]MBB2989467.1 hypothetical protein [Mycolicibacterium iranicum]